MTPKTLSYKSSLLLFLLLLCTFSCKKESLNVLPPETQTGQNIFGCLVDGTLFVNSKTAVYATREPINADYSRIKDEVILGADAKNGAEIYLTILHPQENSTRTINEATYRVPDKVSYCYQLGGINVGEVVITKFDTIHLIISGRFSFSTNQCLLKVTGTTGDSILNISQGRFDIKLRVSDY